MQTCSFIYYLLIFIIILKQINIASIPYWNDQELLYIHFPMWKKCWYILILLHYNQVSWKHTQISIDYVETICQSIPFPICPITLCRNWKYFDPISYCIDESIPFLFGEAAIMYEICWIKCTSLRLITGIHSSFTTIKI